MYSNKSTEQLDLLQQQHEKFANEIIYSLRVHYSIDEYLLHGNECLTNREFVSYNITKAVITIAYLFRHESRKLYGVLREELRDVEKFKTYCMLIPVTKNNRYFYNYLRRVSLISELVIYCYRENKDYFSVASNCIASYRDFLYFESAGGWAKLGEISSFIKDLGKPFELLFDHPITEQLRDFNTMILLHEVDAVIRNDVDLLCSKEMRMFKIIRRKFISHPQTFLIKDSSELISDIGRNINGMENSEAISDEERKHDLNDEKKAIIEYFRRCLIPRVIAKFYENTSEKFAWSESSQKICAKEMADNNIQKDKESNFPFTFVSNNFATSVFDRKPINVSTSTDYHSSTHSDISNDSSSDENSDTVVSGCLPRKKLIKVLLKKRKGNIFHLKRSCRPLVCESLEDQITKRKNVHTKLPQIETSILSRNICTNKVNTETESCSLDEEFYRNRELSEDESLSLRERQIHTSLSDETSQSVKNASPTESLEDKNSEFIELYSSSDQSPSKNSELPGTIETNIESSPEKRSHVPSRIYSSTGSSITSESEFSGCTASLYEDNVEVESSPDSKMDSDDLPKVTESGADEDNFGFEAVVHLGHPLIQPCLLQETECSDGSSKENFDQNELKINIRSIKLNRKSSNKGTENTFYSERGGKYTQMSQRAVQNCHSHDSRDAEEKTSCSKEIFLKKKSTLTECNEYQNVDSAFHVAAAVQVFSSNTENCEIRYDKNETSGITGAVQKHLNTVSKNEVSSDFRHLSFKKKESEQQTSQKQLLETQPEFLKNLIQKYKTERHLESASSENNTVNTAIIPTRPKTIEETCCINIKNCQTASEKNPTQPQYSKAKKKKASKNRNKKK